MLVRYICPVCGAEMITAYIDHEEPSDLECFRCHKTKMDYWKEDEHGDLSPFN